MGKKSKGKDKARKKERKRALLLAAPEQHHTRIQGSKLWHLALLEFWLQRHGIEGA